MPTQLTYPGVYVEELPSGVRTITGVATSITAFVGRTRSGPVDVPHLLHSWADFERQYGGTWLESTLGHAVRDFYRNGGRDALVLRLYAAPAVADGEDPIDGVARFTVGAKVTLAATSPGSWGGDVRVTLDRTDITGGNDRFNLTISEAAPGGRSERILDLSLAAETPRRADQVLARQSNLLRWDGDLPADTTAPTDGTDPMTAAESAVATAQGALITAQKAVREKEQAGEAVPQELVDAVNAATAAVTATQTAVAQAVAATGADDGTVLDLASFTAPATGPGLRGLDQADLFNLLCIPPHAHGGDVEPDLVSAAAAYCETRRAMLIVDPPSSWDSAADARAGYDAQPDDIGTRSRNAAIFFPRLLAPDPARDGLAAAFVPCGAVAGVFARTDAQRGVWKAPAGLDANLIGTTGLAVPLTDAENGDLNQVGINCLRSFPAAGRVVWGSRTLRGADRLADEWKYVPVRRIALYLEESLYRGTHWVVFEPNDEPLWAQIRLSIGAFMNGLFRQGAFKGRTPREAYLVKCDAETTTQADIDLGIVNILVGFAPLKPAEFVVITFQQKAGQVQA